jgi:DNA repair photolyase
MKYKYYNGRFFLSPLLGCTGNCTYCYLPNEIENFNLVRKNKYDIKYQLKEIVNDDNFVKGKNGSIISIGAYCDIFPLDNDDLTQITIEWIIEALKINNPVQIISKNVISIENIKQIFRNINYENQLLYSTTITTFKYHNLLEPNTSNPVERLNLLKKFKLLEVPTNVMIKPLLPGITNKEINEFVDFFQNSVDYCVVGNLLSKNNKINEIIETITNKKLIEETESQILDCSENGVYNTYNQEIVNQFLSELRNNGIRAFKKSSCVNANLLKTNNSSEYYKDENNIYCIKCGNCK